MNATRSKINELNARIDQFKNCGHFTEKEIEILSAPVLKELEELAKEIEVNI